MALTEINLPQKTQFYNRLNVTATEIDILMSRIKSVAEFVGLVETVDLDAMGVAAGQARTDLADFRTALNEIISLYEGGSVTPTNSPDGIIDKIRRM